MNWDFVLFGSLFLLMVGVSIYALLWESAIMLVINTLLAIVFFIARYKSKEE